MSNVLNTVGVSDGNTSNIIPEFWGPSIIRIADRESFWTQLAGTQGSKAAVIEQRDLIKRHGDTINFSLTGRLLRKVNIGNSKLATKEEKLPTGTFQVTVGLRRTATARDYIIDAVSIVRFATDAWPALKEWAKRDMDDQIFNEFLNQSEIKTLFANNRATRAALSSGDVLTTIELIKLNTVARRRGVQVVQRVGRGMLSHPVYMNALSETDWYQLRADPEYKQDVRLSDVRGKDNAVFKGVVTDMFQGMLLFVHSGINNGDGMLGSYLRPEAELRTALTDTTGLTVLAGPSGTGIAIADVDYWQYFPDTGSDTVIRIGTEDMSYTAVVNTTPGDTSLTVVRGANATTAATHIAGSLITLRNTGKIMAFGPESMMRAWARNPNRAVQVEDYENDLGISIRYINGVQQVLSTDGIGKNAVLLETYSPSVSTI